MKLIEHPVKLTDIEDYLDRDEIPEMIEINEIHIEQFGNVLVISHKPTKYGRDEPPEQSIAMLKDIVYDLLVTESEVRGNDSIKKKLKRLAGEKTQRFFYVMRDSSSDMVKRIINREK